MRGVSSSSIYRLGRLSLVDQCKRNRLAALLRFHDLHRKSLALINCAKSRSLDDRNVQEHILLAVLAADESKSLIRIEPLHCALYIGSGCSIEILAARCCPGRWASLWSRCRGSACVNLKHRGDLWAFLTLADLHAQL